MSRPKVKITTEPTVLLARIKAEFPDITWRSYRSVTDGWDHEVIILDEALVFRFPNDDEYTDALRTEINVMRQLRPLIKVAVPDYTYVAKDHSFAGYPIVGGTILSKPLFDSLDILATDAIARQLAGLLTTMHTLNPASADFTGVAASYMPDEQRDVKKLAGRHLAAVLDDDDYHAVQAVLAEVDKLIAQPVPAVFIHGDVYSNHLLWNVAENQLGLIDFSDMTIADPAIDFAELYEYGNVFVETVYDYYTGLKDSTFLDRAWTYQRWNGVYMMTDHFVYHKTTFAVARQTFDMVKAMEHSA